MWRGGAGCGNSGAFKGHFKHVVGVVPDSGARNPGGHKRISQRACVAPGSEHFAEGWNDGDHNRISQSARVAPDGDRNRISQSARVAPGSSEKDYDECLCPSCTAWNAWNPAFCQFAQLSAEQRCRKNFEVVQAGFLQVLLTENAHHQIQVGVYDGNVLY